MARILLIGGGSRGRELAARLRDAGHVVRVTTREESGRAAIEAVGAECWIGTPDRVGTLRYALERVTIACWLLASASGEAEAVAALHGSRLEFFVNQTIDTTVRGLLYETRGCVAAASLGAGRELIERLAHYNAIPLAIVEADAGDQDAWLAEARAAVSSLLEGATA